MMRFNAYTLSSAQHPSVSDSRILVPSQAILKIIHITFDVGSPWCCVAKSGSPIYNLAFVTRSSLLLGVALRRRRLSFPLRARRRWSSEISHQTFT